MEPTDRPKAGTESPSNLSTSCLPWHGASPGSPPPPPTPPWQSQGHSSPPPPPAIPPCFVSRSTCYETCPDLDTPGAQGGHEIVQKEHGDKADVTEYHRSSLERVTHHQACPKDPSVGSPGILDSFLQRLLYVGKALVNGLLQQLYLLFHKSPQSTHVQSYLSALPTALSMYQLKAELLEVPHIAVLNFWPMNKDHGWVSGRRFPKSCLQIAKLHACASFSGEISKAFMMFIDNLCHSSETKPLNPRKEPPRRPIFRASCTFASRRWGAGQASALAVFWEQLYDTLTVILRHAGVALWLSTFPEVQVGSYLVCGSRYYGRGEMKQKRKAQPRLVDIIAAVPPQYRKVLVPKLKAKPIRTASGVSNLIHEILIPYLFCQKSLPPCNTQIPTSMRAIRARYDPYLQTRHRIEQEFFENPAFRPDGLKLYPTLVIRGTGLYELWKSGRYKSYSPSDLIELVARILALVPPWTRVYRVQRDIPMPLVSSGVEHGNLRELAFARMKDLGIQGFGMLLMEEAERIAREEHGSGKIAVISGSQVVGSSWQPALEQ
ncbi:hypothetical protein GH733_011854 [Mirounga leonina]|nr:hypothetical protein GH733_011854 [Mirounga leonina]